MALFGPTSGRSSPASCAQSFSASGSLFVKVLFQDELRGHGVDGLLLQAPELRFGRHGSEALVDQRDRQAVASLELPGEALDAPGERVHARSEERRVGKEGRSRGWPAR